MKQLLSILTFLFCAGILLSGGKRYAGNSGVQTVVIDPGHGGKDPGNLGTRRYKTAEKDIALAVSLKLGSYIQENLPDVKVVYTRKTDVFIPLKERADIANEAKGDVFLSIHCDAFNQQSVHGSTSLVLGRSHGDENRVAIQENSAILMEENYEEKYEGFDPRKPESLIALSMYQNTYLNQSILMAKKIQDQFKHRVNRRDRGVKQQPLYVTSRTAMPAVLVELGFLTNQDEEDFLNSEQGQAYMASAIYRALRNYKEERDKVIASQRQAPTKVRTPEPGNEVAPMGPENKGSSSKVENETEEPTENAGQIKFAVQLLTSARDRDLNARNFKGVQNVKMLKEGGLFKYYVGPVNDFREAEELKQRIKSQGYSDAFVIGMQDGRKISATKARKMLR